MNFKMIIPLGLALLFLGGCEPTHETYNESNYLGGVVTNVYGETYIETTGSSMSRRSYRVNECNVTVAYEDGYVKTFVEDVEPVYCYKLQVNDWVDGWTNERWRRNIRTQETVMIDMERRINIAQEISKRLN